MTDNRQVTKVIGYCRTSSATNVGGDSETRQRVAIERYAAAHGLVVVDWYYDAAVSGADAVQDRPGFSAMLDRIEGNGVRTVLVEDASRFARDLLVQEAGLAMLAARGVTVLTSTGDNLTDCTDPMRKMMRQIVGAVMEAEKARLVAKLKAARDRKSAAVGHRIEGDTYEKRAPGVYAALVELRQADPGATLAELGERLAERGFRTRNGKIMMPTQVHRLLQHPAAHPA